MKVVLFCGGAGMRLRGYVDDVPKPMVQIGNTLAFDEVLCAFRAQRFHPLSRSQR